MVLIGATVGLGSFGGVQLAGLSTAMHLELCKHLLSLASLMNSKPKEFLIYNIFKLQSYTLKSSTPACAGV